MHTGVADVYGGLPARLSHIILHQHYSANDCATFILIHIILHQHYSTNDCATCILGWALGEASIIKTVFFLQKNSEILRPPAPFQQFGGSSFF